MALSDLYPGVRPGTPYAGRWRSFLDDLRLQGISVDPTQSGGYNPRNVRGTTMPSLHASDRAYDVNWRANPEGTRQDEADIARQHLERDMGGSTAPITQLHPMLARETAARHGLRWGGDFRTRSPDPMHFEVAGPAPGGMPGRSLVAHAGLAPPTTQPAPAGGQAMANGGSWLDWIIPQAEAATSGAFAPQRRQEQFGPPRWMYAPPTNTVQPRNPRTGAPIPPLTSGRSRALGGAGAMPAAAAAPMGVPNFGQIGDPFAGDWSVGVQPPSPPTIEAPLPITPPDPNAIMAGATAAHGQNNPPQPPRPGFFEGLHNWVASPMFQSAIALATQRDPTAAMAQAGLAQRQQSEFQRQQQQRTVMDRIWGEAFPNGQPNMSHPLLANQSPQVAAMIAGMGPEMALPLLAKSAMERRQLELKDIGGQGVVFNPTTGQVQQIPSTQGGRPPSGFRWSETQPGQLEAIPGGPAEHVAAEVAGRLAIMQTARPGMQAAREFFTRRWSPGETARNTIGGSMVAPEYDRHRRTVRLAVEGSLRAMTGAAAPQSEVDQYMAMFMPAVTDPPEIARQKLDLLDQFMRNAEEIVTRGRRQGGPQQQQQPATRLRYDPTTGELVNAN